MKKLLSLFKLCACLAVFSFLFACGASSNAPDDAGKVQDIEPGQGSIIQPPARTPAQQGSQLEERAL